jgi:FKBP-type peptidyl-prolyl cis-trans isomerase 2
MADIVKENDFVELDYVGKIVDGGEVFDTTSEETAKESDLFNDETKYEPAIVCIGKNHLLKGLDKNLVGKEIGKSHTFKLSPEDAFGKKNAKLIQLIATSKFRQQKINPFPGLQVNIDNMIGIIKTVTGGRTIVDFNHPLSGKELEYTVTVNKIVTDLAEKVKAMIKLIGIDIKAVEVSVSEGNAKLEFVSEVPEDMKKDVEQKLKGEISDLKSVSFSVKTPTDTKK